MKFISAIVAAAVLATSIGDCPCLPRGLSPQVKLAPSSRFADKGLTVVGNIRYVGRISRDVIRSIPVLNRLDDHGLTFRTATYLIQGCILFILCAPLVDQKIYFINLSSLQVKSFFVVISSMFLFYPFYRDVKYAGKAESRLDDIARDKAAFSPKILLMGAERAVWIFCLTYYALGQNPGFSNFKNISLYFAVVLAPIYEEVIFRAGLFGGFRALFRKVLKREKLIFLSAAVLSSTVFSFGHINRSPEEALSRFAWGMILAYMYQRTGKLIVPIMTHAANNGLFALGCYAYPSVFYNLFLLIIVAYSAAHYVTNKLMNAKLTIMVVGLASLFASGCQANISEISTPATLLGCLVAWVVGVTIIIFLPDMLKAFLYVKEKAVGIFKFKIRRHSDTASARIENPRAAFLEAIRPALEAKGFSGIELIGEGGNAYVYKASYRDKVVALRVEKASGERRRKERTALGGKVMKWILRKGHPAIERIYSAGIIRVNYRGRNRRLAYHVLEYVNGKTISQLKREGYFKKIGFYRTVESIAQILEGLNFIHSKGLYYGSMNSETNVMIDDSGRVKIIDLTFHKPFPIQIGYKQRQDLRAASGLIANILYERSDPGMLDAETISRTWFDNPTAHDNALPYKVQEGLPLVGKEAVRKMIDIIERMREGGSSVKLPKVIDELRGIKDCEVRHASLAPETRFEAKNTDDLNQDFADPMGRFTYIRDKDGKLIKEQIGTSGRWLCFDKTEKKGLPNEAFMRVIKSFSIAMKELKRLFDKVNLVVVDSLDSEFTIRFPEDESSPIELTARRDFLYKDRFKQREALKCVIASPWREAPVAKQSSSRRLSLSPYGEASHSQKGIASVATLPSNDRLTNILFLEVKQKYARRESHPVPPWAFYLASAVSKSYADSHRRDQLKINFEAIDDEFKDLPKKEEEVRELAKGKTIIALTVYEQTFEAVSELAKIIRKHSDAFIAIGGPMATAFPEQVAALIPEANVIVRGEGDQVFPKIAEALEGLSIKTGLSQEAIQKLRNLEQGIILRTNDTFISNNTNRQNFISDMDKIEFDFALLDKDWFGTSMLILNTERGCSERCVFCVRVNGRVFRAMSAERIIEHIRIYLKRLDELNIPPNSKARTIHITDDDFLADSERAVKFLEAFEKEFKGRLRLDSLQASINSFFLKDAKGKHIINKRGNRILNKRLIKAVNRPEIFASGTPHLHIGTDGFSDEELKRLNKGYVFRDAEKVIRALDRSRVHSGHYWIMSNPDTLLIDFLTSFLNIFRLKRDHPNTFQIVNHNNPYVIPIRGTITSIQLLKRGLDLEAGRVDSVKAVQASGGFEEFDYVFIWDVYPDLILESKEAEGPPYPMTGKRLFNAIDRFNDAVFGKLNFAQETWPHNLSVVCFTLMSVVNRYNYMISQGGDLSVRAKEEVRDIEEQWDGIKGMYALSLDFIKAIIFWVEQCLENIPYIINDEPIEKLTEPSSQRSERILYAKRCFKEGAASKESIEMEAVRFIRIARFLRALFLNYPELGDIDVEIKAKLSKFASDEKLSQGIKEELSELLNPTMKKDEHLWKYILFHDGSLPKPVAPADTLPMKELRCAA